MKQFSGMIFERARSFGAQVSLANFLAGHFGAEGTKVIKVVRKVSLGPGVLIRRSFAKALPLFFTPLLVWLISWLYYFYNGPKEVCWGGIVGVRVACRVIETERVYSLGRALQQVYWLMFFFLFEGDSTIFEPNVGISVVWSLLSCIFFFLDHNVFKLFGVSTLLLGSWSVGWGVMIPVKWFAFVEVFFSKGSSLFWLFFVAFEVVAGHDFKSTETDSSWDDFEVRSRLPSKYLSIALPPDACVLSDGYFTDVPVAMTNDERLMALLGDRFLGALGVMWLQEYGLQVSTVRGVDDLQTDDALLAWVDSLVTSTNSKKKRASFAEVLWGEVCCCFAKNEVTFFEVWEAFVKFQKDVADVNKLVVPVE
jgi:hypothetical protein